VQVSDFRCIRPFGRCGKWPPDHQHVSSSLSKIPYSGFSPVRLQTGFQPRPSSTMPSLSARPAFPHPWRIYTRLKSLSPKRALFRNGTCVQAELPSSDAGYPVQRSLAPQRVMLSRRIFAYYYLIRASRPLPRVYVLSSGSLPYGLVWAGNERVPNLSCLSFPIVPSSVPRRPNDCSRLLLDRSLWPSPSSQKVGIRLTTLAGSLRGSCNEAAKFASCYGSMELLALLRQGLLLSSFHLLGHPWGASSITTRANNQFPWPDFHRLDKQPYRLRTKITKVRNENQKKFPKFVSFVRFVVSSITFFVFPHLRAPLRKLPAPASCPSIRPGCRGRDS
jgi:hypothetical protein